MFPVVIWVPGWMRILLAHVPRWKETKLLPETRIGRHSHRFWAVYFTFGVKVLTTARGVRQLPHSALVIVPPAVEHGWSGTADGAAIVGHFHVGHPVHEIESLRPASA